MIYTAAQREDGTPVPVKESVYRQPHPTRPGEFIDWNLDYGFINTQHYTRPVSWALILPGDTVLWGEDRFTVISTHETGSVDLWTPDEQPSGRPAGWHTTGFAGRSCTDELTLVCDEIPEHRASHPAWQWPTP